jgi:hypothetical protein
MISPRLLERSKRDAKATADKYITRRGKEVAPEEMEFNLGLDKLGRAKALELCSQIRRGLDGPEELRKAYNEAAFEAFLELMRYLRI